MDALNNATVSQNSTQKLYGVLAQFETAQSVYKACEKVRDRGFLKWDAHSPFPIHGLDKAMGLPQSKLPWLVGAVSLVCGAAGFWMCEWMNGIDYKFNIAGKPYFSWPAYFLPAFECAVLSAAATCLIGMLVLNRLPQWHHSLFRSARFARTTDDKFFISIEVQDPQFHASKTVDFLREIGATHVEFVEQ